MKNKIYVSTLVIIALLMGCSTPLTLPDRNFSQLTPESSAVVFYSEINSKDPVIKANGCTLFLKHSGTQQDYKIQTPAEKKLILIELPPGKLSPQSIFCHQNEQYNFDNCKTCDIQIYPGKISFIGSWGRMMITARFDDAKSDHANKVLSQDLIDIYKQLSPADRKRLVQYNGEALTEGHIRYAKRELGLNEEQEPVLGDTTKPAPQPMPKKSKKK